MGRTDYLHHRLDGVMPPVPGRLTRQCRDNPGRETLEDKREPLSPLPNPNQSPKETLQEMGASGMRAAVGHHTGTEKNPKSTWETSGP